MADEWDAGTYERVSEPQLEWGRRVVERIPLAGDERVIDAGCGTGRVTRLLAERVPRGEVEGVDGSRRMVEEATRLLADLAPRVRIRQSDLLELVVDRPADLIVSTATFHWILDHERLFARLHAALRPGGRLVAQCGGAGNIARTLQTAAEVVRGDPAFAPAAGIADAWLFADSASTVARLREAGFEETTAWLEEAPALFDGPEPGAEFLATVVLRHHVRLLGAQTGARLARAVAERLVDGDGRVVVDYVRLNMQARRPGEPRSG
jgi:trans-aconitate 2-methyltransferase